MIKLEFGGDFECDQIETEKVLALFGDIVDVKFESDYIQVEYVHAISAYYAKM